MHAAFPFLDAHDLDFGRLHIARRGGGRLLLPVAPCLLRLTGRVVLVDAGLDPGLAERMEGVEWQRPVHGLARQLADLGLTPDDVGDVVLTHLHDDHASGVFDRVREAPVFPNARIHVQELALWRGLERVARGGERFISEPLLEWLDDSPGVERHHGDWRLCDELQVSHTGGHTPGHQIILAGDGRLHRLPLPQEGEEGLSYQPAVAGDTRAGDSASGDLLLGGDLLSLGACFNPGFRTSSDVEPTRALRHRQDLAAGQARGLSYYLYHGLPGRRFRGHGHDPSQRGADDDPRRA